MHTQTHPPQPHHHDKVTLSTPGAWCGIALCWLLSMGVALPAWGKVDYLKDAQQALANSDLLKMKYAIVRYEKRLKDPTVKRSPQDKTNGLLWISLLRAQYHQISGTPPSFVRMRQYETKGQVKRQLDALEYTIPHLKAAITHLRSYVIRFRRTLKRAKIRDELTIVTTSNRIAILKNSLRIVKNRIPHLENLLRLWDQETPAQRKIRMQMLMQTLNQGQMEIQKLRDRQKHTRKQLKKQGRMIAEAQKVLQQHQSHFQQKEKVSGVLVPTGIGLLIAGAAGVVVGVVLLNPAEKNIGCLDVCTQQRRQGYTVLVAISAVLASAGAGLLITGLAIKPGQNDRFKGVYKSHKRYLKWDKSNKETSASLSPPPTSTAKVLWHSPL